MPLKKTCNKCQCEKDATSFYANKRMKDGLNTFCIECHKADNVARKSRLRTNPDFKKTEQEYKQRYRSNTIEQRAAYMQKWRSMNKEHLNASSKEYRANNKARCNHLCQLRKIALLQRTPAWLTNDDLWIIQQAYELAAQRAAMTGFAWHVDHEIPLRGKKVSGFHVPQNIRVIPGVDNMRKTNKYEV